MTFIRVYECASGQALWRLSKHSGMDGKLGHSVVSLVGSQCCVILVQGYFVPITNLQRLRA